MEQTMSSRWLIWLAMAVEDFRPGYPQFSALIASHPSFHVCRRFLRIRARLLLLKQDELSLLESQLDNIDNAETRELFLGNRRRDANTERKDILGKIEVALASYGVSLSPLPTKIEALTLMLFVSCINADSILDGNRRILAFDDPRKTDTTNLQNWVENTSSLAQDETAYLLQPKDLMTILSPQDAASARLTPLLEGVMRTLYRLFRKVSGPQITLVSRHPLQLTIGRLLLLIQPQSDVSRDPNISLFSTSILQRLTRAIIASIVVILLLVPIVILNALASIALRMAVIVIASAFLIIAVSSFTNAKTVEVFVSGAT